MQKKLVVQLLIVAVLVVGGLVGFFQVVPVTTVNLSPLSRLVFTNPNLPHVQGASSYSAPTAVSATTLPSLLQGYDIDPGETGGYTEQWFGTGSNGGSVALFLELLPNSTLATQAYNEQYSRDFSSTALKGLKATLESRYTIPGIAKSTGIYYKIPLPPRTTQTGKTQAVPPTIDYSGLIQVGRVVVRIDVQGQTSSKSQLVGLDTREVTLINKGLPGLKNMSAKSYPVGSMLLWFGGMVLLLILVFLIPYTEGRIRAARLAREEARRRYQLRSRGSKVVRRQRVVRR